MHMKVTLMLRSTKEVKGKNFGKNTLCGLDNCHVILSIVAEFKIIAGVRYPNEIPGLTRINFKKLRFASIRDHIINAANLDYKMALM